MDEPSNYGRSARWPRLIGELVVVALGVFLGLAADAAWDTRQERRLESSYLANLSEEMRRAKEELSLDDELRSRRLGSLESLQAQFDARTASDSLVWEWINDSRGTSAFFPSTAVLDDLVSSGNLQFITSSDLRVALMSYAQERPRLRYTEGIEQNFWASDLLPFLVERLSLTSPSASPGSIDSLMTSRTFENLISLRLNQLRASIRRSEDMSRAIDRVVELLEDHSAS